MLNKFIRLVGGDPNKRVLQKFDDVVVKINAFEPQYEALDDEALSALTGEFRSRLAQGETLDDLLPEAFAAVREASKRTLGLRHYDVQMIGGIALHQGTIAEMRTGEGKTLVATLPVYLNALTGRGVHLITVNDYLARRDARWMGPIYHKLGINVGVLQMAARTENGKKAFLYDPQHDSIHEDQHQMRMVPRQEAYLADVVYGMNSEFGFDYLRDNMTPRLEDRVQRGHYYAIVDEVDNVLIDEARTPLIISGPASDESDWYQRMAQVVRQLRPEDYEINEKDRNVTLNEIGETHVEELLEIPLRDPERPEDVTPEQARLMGYLEQALRAQFLFKRNKDYVVQDRKVVIVDEFTGRLMPGRRWSDGLHQSVEAKEGVRVQAENVTYATITIQNYFRMYEKLAGMTGTALTEAEEFHKIYKLEVLAIPTNLEYRTSQPDAPLKEVEGRDEQGYKYKYYTRRDDAQAAPIFFRRKDYPDVVYRTEEAKFRFITREIARDHAMGRPVLVGSTSVELSEKISARLKAEPLRRLMQVLLLRDAWFQKNRREEDGRQVPELQYLYVPLDDLSQSDMRKMARDLEISFNPQDEANLKRLCAALDLSPQYAPRLSASLAAGIPHQVLNARMHAEEGEIIARAGAFGAVTIATNMAGRGVDIRLGGELSEEVIEDVRRVLQRHSVAQQLTQNGLQEVDQLPLLQWPKALALIDPVEFGARAEAVQAFLDYLKDEEQVRALGGLQVIGSERHEARRIDNQLRGRSARQGDPGSSRFYLSMEDELMRLFGGQQADSLMQRLKIDDDLPLEVGLVSRLVEQAQTRVEGANFDVRKHLLEYDDVLNTQRKLIYGQRDRIFTKDDLSEDVTEMLRAEVQRRVPEALKDSEGPWKLLAWLEQIQPSMQLGNLIVPSYTLKLLLDHMLEKKDVLTSPGAAQQALLDLAGDAVLAENDHFENSVETLLEASGERLEEQKDERLEVLDTFFEGLGLEEGEDGQPAPQRSPRELADELVGLLHIPLKLSPEQARLLRDDPEEARKQLEPVVEFALQVQALTRLLGAVERRLGEPLNLVLSEAAQADWEQASEEVLTRVRSFLSERHLRLVKSEDGLIARDLTTTLGRFEGTLTSAHLTNLLLMMPQGSRAVFDKKTHKRVLQRTTRLSYTFLAMRLLDARDPETLAQEVLEHLEGAQRAIRQTWGLSAWPQVANLTLNEVDDKTREGIENLELSPETLQALRSQPLQSLKGEELLSVINELGRRALTEIYRPLLLGVISELWVEYLTQMEALRVSIGLEAYAQRDPLVQYKSKASELFQTLLRDMRAGVVSRMFTYHPRDLSGIQAGSGAGRRRDEEKETLDENENGELLEPEMTPQPDVDANEDTEEGVIETPEPDTAVGDLSRSQKRRRRRH